MTAPATMDRHRMPENILMPVLSPGMTEAKLARWLRGKGDAVKAGDVIAEIETDKATLEFEATAAGVLGDLLVAEGSVVGVNAPIAVLLRDGEAPPAARPPGGDEALPAPDAAPARNDGAPRPSEATDRGPGPRRVFASPIARRLARELGVDLATLAGSGPNGRVVRADVERAASRPKRAEAPLPEPASAPEPGARRPPASAATTAPESRPAPWQATTPVPNSTMRSVIARRLAESKRTIPHYYLTMDAELDALLDARKRLNDTLGEQGTLTVNDFVVKAIALALRKVPAANATWTDEAILRFDAVDVSVAVATPAGLVTPVVRDADRKSLAAVSAELKELAARARAGRLRPEEYQGGGFTVTNLGMHGIREFAAIINPPQSGILAVGAAEPRPVVRDGAVVVRTIMTCTLSADHRSVDGAVGAELLAAFRARIEDPLLLLL